MEDCKYIKNDENLKLTVVGREVVVITACFSSLVPAGIQQLPSLGQ